MKLQCPNCHKILDEAALQQLPCQEAACLPPKFGVHRLMEPGFHASLSELEGHFQDFRAGLGVRIEDPGTYERMPYIGPDEPHYYPEWKLFQNDLAILPGFKKNAPSNKALNFGSWNGWLSNQLVKRGYSVTAIAYFVDQYDGLGAQQFYQNKWASVQMDIEDQLDILQDEYQLIVLNRGTAFLHSPTKTVARLKSKLCPGGQLILTGLHFYGDPSKAKVQYQNYQAKFQEQYGIPLQIKPTKGYLDLNDRHQLSSLGLSFRTYPGKYLPNLVSRFWPTKARYEYGIYQAPSS